jgi:hypothetical protein
MGYTSSTEWPTKQALIDDFVERAKANGYDVKVSGNWLYGEKDGKPVALSYLITRKFGAYEWGYKEVPVADGPCYYNAPLWMVRKVHPVFKDGKYYQGWLEKYPYRDKVLEGEAVTAEPSLFEEVA